MSFFNFFQKRVEVNQKAKETIKHFLTTTNLNNLQKSSIIYYVKSISDMKSMMDKKSANKNHEEFIRVCIELSGLTTEKYSLHVNAFKASEMLINQTFENMSVRQKAVIVILFESLISHCEHNNDDWSKYADVMIKVYKSLDRDVSLMDIASIETLGYFTSREWGKP